MSLAENKMKSVQPPRKQAPAKAKRTRRIPESVAKSDLSVRRYAEKQLAQMDKRYRMLLEAAPDAMVVVNQGGEIVLLNKQAELQFGYRRSELLGHKIEELMPKRYRGIHPQHMSDFFLQPRTCEMGGELELFGLRKDGTEFPVEISLSPLDTDEGILAISTIHDITARKQIEHALRTNEELFRIMLMQAPLGIAMIDSLSGYIYKVNPRFAEIVGRTMEEMANLNWLQITHPDDIQADLDNMTLLNAGEINGFQMEKRYLHPDGTAVWIDMTVSPLIVEDTTHPRHLCMIQDITDRKENESRIIHLNRVYAVLSGINTLIVRVQDRDELFREACRIAVEKGGFLMSLIGIVDQSTMQVVPIASMGKDKELLSAIKSMLSSDENASNTMIAQAVREKQAIVSNDSQNDPRVLFGQKYAESGVQSMAVLPLISADEATGILALYAGETDFFNEEEMKLLLELAGDIAFAIDHIEKQKRLEYITHYDALTGLANRSQFHNQLTQSLRGRRGEQRLIAIVILDLERFRHVNETLGRTSGDNLLREVGSRLQRANNSVARIGNDLFSLILRGLHTEIEIIRTLEAVFTGCFNEPYTQGGKELRMACRAGIALFPSDGTDVDTLLRNAEAALRRSKHSGDRIVFYESEMNARVAEALALETRLRQAVERREFVLHYQPQVALMGGHITGVEALIRWQDPDKGLVAPYLFIPILEETGMIIEIGRWVVEQAFVDLRTWSARGISVPRIAVNVSPLQFQNKGFVDSIIDEIQRGGNSPDRLELEITEGIVMGNVEDTINKLSILRNMGVSIAIDDFGTGYSSLSYLARLPLDTLKIDQSFVSGMTGEGESASIVSTIIVLAHALKLKVVAEGVETEEQSRLLRLLNCDEMQGYLFSKPVPADILETRFLVPPPAGKK